MAAIVFDNSFARLPDGFFAKVNPDEVADPSLIQVNQALAADLGLDAEWLASPEGLAMLSGGGLPATAEPISMVYAGHQFGGWAPQLGDGRAVLLGEVVGRDGLRRDIQLKGSGRTPFSRQGDGKSPLGPVLREYIVSEAMAAFGVPTTRALAAVATGETVHREAPLPGAILVRVAQSHIRVGTFQYFEAQGQTELLRRLSDYVIDRHYPEARGSGNPYRALLEGIVQRQANLIAQWMQLGFIHGVMNTDNMQIAGETIDFGPCAFMENFDAETVLSSIDRQGRYAWCNQAGIGQWNLTRLAEALLPLLADDQDEAIAQAKIALAPFGAQFNDRFLNGFREKMGLEPVDASSQAAAQEFLDATLSTLTREHVDFTLFFRQLTRIASGQGAEAFLALFDDREAGVKWLEEWRTELSGGGNSTGNTTSNASGTASGSVTPSPSRVERMRSVNPIFIPRNHRVEQAIQSALQGDYSLFERLNRVLSRPFDEQPEDADLERPASPDERVRRTFCGT